MYDADAYRKEAVRLMGLGRETHDTRRRVAYFELAQSYIKRAEIIEATMRRHETKAG